MFGDSTALTLAIGLSEHQSHYDITEYDQGILGCGVTEGAEFQLKGVDAPDGHKVQRRSCHTSSGRRSGGSRSTPGTPTSS